jgi:hypothetical protein
MKKLGLIIALLGIASGAVYAGTKIFTKTKDNVAKGKNGDQSVRKEEDDDIDVIQSSISRSYVYVADF